MRTYFKICIPPNWKIGKSKKKKMGNFLNTHYLSKLNQDQLINLNRPIMPSEIEAVIKSLPTKKKKKRSPGPGDFNRVLSDF